VFLFFVNNSILYFASIFLRTFYNRETENSCQVAISAPPLFADTLNLDLYWLIMESGGIRLKWNSLSPVLPIWQDRFSPLTHSTKYIAFPWGAAGGWGWGGGFFLYRKECEIKIHTNNEWNPVVRVKGTRSPDRIQIYKWWTRLVFFSGTSLIVLHCILWYIHKCRLNNFRSLIGDAALVNFLWQFTNFSSLWEASACSILQGARKH
jgi:hypothetical protein